MDAISWKGPQDILRAASFKTMRVVDTGNDPLTAVTMGSETECKGLWRAGGGPLEKLTRSAPWTAISHPGPHALQVAALLAIMRQVDVGSGNEKRP